MFQSYIVGIVVLSVMQTSELYRKIQLQIAATFEQVERTRLLLQSLIEDGEVLDNGEMPKQIKIETKSKDPD